MCFHYKPPEKIEFKGKLFEGAGEPLNGFTYPQAPIFSADHRNIELAKWGLLPFWAKDTKIAANTLNARIETIEEKPAFRNSVKNRCVVFAEGFFEWQWLDEKGKQKQKYYIESESGLILFAGLYSDWNNIRTFTICTTEANELMSVIHNNKKRMPVFLETEEIADYWLAGGKPSDFAHPNIELKAEPVSS